MRPLPTRCPFCHGPAPCIDWNEVDFGVGVQQFEFEFECSAHGVFAYDYSSGANALVPIWRDGDPNYLVARGLMSPRGHCNASISAADGGVLFCMRRYLHGGRHENAGTRWSGDSPWELCDAAFEEVLVCLS